MEGPINRFMKELGTRYSASRNTIRMYGGHVRRLAKHLDTLGVSLTEATQEHLEKYLNDLRDLPLSKHTIGRHIAAFRAFYAFAEQRGLRPGNPAAHLVSPIYRNPLPTPTDNSDAESLAASTSTGTLWTMRDHIVIEIVRSTGIRPFELVALNRDDVHLAAGTIRVAGSPKNARTFVLSPLLIRDLTQYLPMLGERAGPLIVNRYHKRTTTRTVDRIFVKYAKATKTAITPRNLRHGLALKTVRQGARPEAVKRLLGFSNPVSAAFYYRSIQRVSRGSKEARKENPLSPKSTKHNRGAPRRFFPSLKR